MNNRSDTVFVEHEVQKTWQRDRLLGLLREHVQGNIVKIGKKFFRQKAGIPQGSVLSSLLCNLYYAEFEKEHLAFIHEEESLLIRLIDDFLLITTSKASAERFLQTMHDGVKKYGVEVNPAKSLTNFAVKINDCNLECWPPDQAFPYCGNAIDTRTLEITKDRDRRKNTIIANTLTVGESKIPGQTFYRKVQQSFKIQSQKMLLDTSFNCARTVLLTIYENFSETAMKYYRYGKSMANCSQPHLKLAIGESLPPGLRSSCR